MSRASLLAAIILLSSCATFKSYNKYNLPAEIPEGEPYHSVYLFGNTDLEGNVPFRLQAVMKNKTAQDQTILMLGNNLLKDGFRSQNVKKDLESLHSKIAFFKDLDAEVYFITGEHEWSNGGKRGFAEVRQIENLVDDDEEESGNLIFPDGGCPGPEEIQIGQDVVLLLINTQWFLHEWDRPQTEEGCEADTEKDFLDNLDDAIKRNYNKKIIVAGHHSLFSSSVYGGFYPPKAHVFPLTLAKENLYIPLPVIGSVYLGFRKLFGEHQDLQNYKYARMRNALLEIIARHSNLIYTSAHGLNLEYSNSQNNHFINSGSFLKADPIGDDKADFSSAQKGFAKLDLYNSGEVWLSFFDREKENAAPVFRKLLFKNPPFSKKEFRETVSRTDYSDSTITTYITEKYLKKNNKPGPLGQNYRKEWAARVENVRYFDLEKEKGGMEIEKKGGGMQTKSLRLEAEDEKEYVLRSMQKFPENAVPDELRGTFAEHLITEQISASHPYAAFTIPVLAEAAGIYHTNPEIVYLPDDPRLGIYRKSFGGGLYLYEERPDDDRSDVASFGNSKEIISTDDVIKKTMKDGDHVIDQEFVVRSRLFDIFIGDWDRHEDQWRWAKFKKGDDVKLYRPIPRDRDNAFFWSDGWFMELGTHKWGLPKFQGFHHKIRDVEGFNFNARHFDRTFMNETSLEDWLIIAEDLQNKITDESIEKAIHQMPPEVFALHGKEIISKLKARRDDLQEYAIEYYLFLAKEVDITGTKKRDLFIVERLDDQQTKVSAYRIKNKSGEIKYKMYERIFRTSETNEIRIYGFGDDDIFNVHGNVHKGPKVRIVGGGGEDLIDNESSVKGPGKNTIVYDTKTGTELRSDQDTRNKTTDKDPLINEYNRKSFQYDLVAPLLYGGYNPDDGIYVGLGTMIKTHGFRKEPFKSSHFIVGNVAPKSASFNVSYKGTFIEIFGKWSANLNSSIFYPSYSDFFYGFGNESTFNARLRESDKRYYAARYQQIRFNPEIFRTSNSETHIFTLGAGYQLINVKEDRNDNERGQDRFIHEYINLVDHKIFNDWRQFASLYLQYELDTRNSSLYPQRGMNFLLKTGYTKDLDDNTYEVNFSSTESRLAFYYTFGNTFKSTLAARTGAAFNSGNYEFYHANTLGGGENLRGYRKQRFAGDISFYQNTDLRIRLVSFRTILFPGEAGIVVFHDIGRVWMDNDPSVAGGDSDFWHRGYGAGFFIAPFGKAAITLDYSQSNTQESAFFVRLGFLF